MAKDSLGRDVDLGDMSIKDVKSMLQSLMSGAVGPKTDVGNKKDPTTEKIAEVASLLESLNKTIGKDLKEAVAYMEMAVAAKDGKSSSSDAKAFTNDVTQSMTSLADNIKDLHKHATTKGSLYVHDQGAHDLLTKIYDQLSSGGSAIPSSIPSAPSPSSPSGGNIAPRRRRAISYDDDYGYDFDDPSKRLFKQIEKATAATERTIFAISEKGESLQETLFGGLVDNQLKFIKDSRQAAYAVAGITGEAKGLQKQFTEVERSAYLTGFGREELQKQYLTNLKTGIRDLKTAQKISVASLNTENQLGLAAGSLNENFRDLNLQAKFTDAQIADAGRGMREVARNTGLTGEALTKAIGSSKQFTEQMRNAATLTASANKNILEIVANAQKLGVDKAASAILSKATSSADLILNASDQTSNLLYRAASAVGRVGDLQKGILTRSKAGLKDLGKGFESILKQFGVQSLEAIDNLTDEDKFRINVQLKAAYGVELGELRNLTEVLNESGKGLSDRLADINKKMQGNLTLEEKNALMEEIRQKKTSAALSALTALDEAAKGAKDMNQALAKFGSRKSEFEGDIKALGGSFGSATEAARVALNESIKNINAGLQQSGKEGIKVDSSEIEKALRDPTALRELTAKITKGEQELATAQKAQLDPMTAVQQSFAEYNDLFKDYSTGAINSLTNLVGKTGFMVAGIGTIGIQLASLTANLTNKSGLIGGLAEQIGSLAAQGKEGGLGGIAASLGDYIFNFSKIKQSLSPIFGESAALTEAAAEEAGGLPTPVPTPTPTPTPVPTPPPAPLPTGLDAICQQMLTVLKDQLDLMKKDNIQSRIKFTKKYFTDYLKPMAKHIEELKTALVAGPIPSPSTTSPSGSPPVTTPGGDDSIIDGLNSGAFFDKAQKFLQEQGPKLAVMAVALVALATGIIAIANKILKFSGLNIQEAVETAAAIGTILGSTAILIKATIEGYKKLDEYEGEINALKPEKSLKVGLKIGALALALFGLATGVVYAVNKIAEFAGINIATVAETAGTIAGVLGSVGLIAEAVKKAIPYLEENAEFFDSLYEKIPAIARGAIVVGLLAPAMVLLGVAVLALTVGLAKLSGFDAQSALKSGLLVAAIIGSAGIIAASVAGAIFGLEALGTLATGLNPATLALIEAGAWTLLLAGPALTLLGIGVLALTSGIASLTGFDAGTALKAGLTVAAIIFSAGLIAVSTLAALEGLFQLGLLAPALYLALPLIYFGAETLLLFAPAMTLLGLGVLALTAGVASLTGISASDALKSAGLVAAIIFGAGLIAVATIAGIAGLYGLGELAKKLNPAAIGSIFLGAGLLFLLAPAMTALGSALLLLTNSVAGAFNIDAGKAEEISNTIAAIIYGAGKIALATVAGIAGLAALGYLGTQAVAYIPLILIGGVALAILAPAIAALGAGLLSFIDGVASNFDIDAKKAEEVGDLVSTIIYACGKIAVATAFGIAGLALFPAVLPLVPLAWLGGKILKWLAPGLVELGAGLLNVIDAKAALADIDSGTVKETADFFEALLVGLGRIADATLSGLNSLANFGVALVGLFFYWPFIRKGQEAFRTVVPDLLLLGTIITWQIGTLADAFGLDAEIVAEAGEIFTALADTISIVVEKSMQALNSLAVLGAFSVLAFFISPLIYAGKLAFYGLVGELVGLAAALAVAHKMFIAVGFDAEVGEEISMILNQMQTIFHDISSVLNDFVGTVIPLFSSWSIFGSVSYQIQKYIPEIRTAFFNIVSFLSSGIIAPLFMLPPPAALEHAKKILEPLPTIFSSIAAAINSVANELVPLFKDGWIFSSAASKIKPLIPEMREGIATVTSFVGEGIIDPVLSNIGNPRDAKIAAEALKATSEIIQVLPSVINGVATDLARLTKTGFFGGASKFTKALDVARGDFKESFTEIAKFIDEGIINPIFANIGNPRDVKIAAEALKGISEMIPLIPPVVDSIEKELGPFVNKPSGRKKIAKALRVATGGFKENFEALTMFIDQGIITPIFQNIGNPRDVKIAAEALKGISEIVPLIPVVIKDLTTNLAPLVKGNGRSAWRKAPLDKLLQITPFFQESFIKLAQFLDEGIITPIFEYIGNPRDVKIAAEALAGISQIVTTLPGIIQTLVYSLPWMYNEVKKMTGITDEGATPGEAAMTFANIYKFLNAGLIDPIFSEFKDVDRLLQAVEIMKLIGKVVLVTKESILTMGKVLNDFYGGFFGFFKSPVAKAGDKVKDFAKFFKGIAKALNEGIVGPVVNNLPESSLIQDAIYKIQYTTELSDMLPSNIQRIAANLNSISQSGIGFDPSTSGDYLNGFFLDLGAFVDVAFGSGNLTATSEALEIAVSEVSSIESSFASLAGSLESIQASMIRIAAVGDSFGGLNLSSAANNIASGISTISSATTGLVSSTFPNGPTNQIRAEYVSTGPGSAAGVGELSGINAILSEEVSLTRQMVQIMGEIRDSLADEGADTSGNSPSGRKITVPGFATGNFNQSSIREAE